MINVASLLNSTSAYQTVKNDIKTGKSSHAYFFISQDGDFHKEILKEIAKLFLPEISESRIEKESCPDLLIYPKGEVINKDEVISLISECFVKPLESGKKVFIITHCENMNATCQNKLLKTLEEPPKSVVFLLISKSEYPLLSTVKSRVKKLEIGSFPKSALVNALINDCPDKDKLERLADFSDGTLSGLLSLYQGSDVEECLGFITKIISELKSSRDVLAFSGELSMLKADYGLFLSLLEQTYLDMLRYFENKNLVKNKDLIAVFDNCSGYNFGAVLYILDKIKEANKRKTFNANQTMLNEWLLFSILEGKYKWQKL